MVIAKSLDNKSTDAARSIHLYHVVRQAKFRCSEKVNALRIFGNPPPLGRVNVERCSWELHLNG